MLALRRSVLAAILLTLLLPSGARTWADGPAAGTLVGGHTIEWWVEKYLAATGPPGEQHKAYAALKGLGESAVPALAAVLKDPDPDRRARAAGTLQWLPGSPVALLDECRARLRDADPAERIAAAGTLAYVQGKAAPAAQALGALLADADPAVRLLACEAAAALGAEGKALAEALEPLVRDPDPAVARAATDAIARVRPRR